LSPVLGAQGYRNIIQKMKEYGYKTPIIAIGGIIKTDIPELKRKGVYGVALSGELSFAKDKHQLISEIHSLLEAE
jgi:thiamine-phosphate pyrophosphorylase